MKTLKCRVCGGDIIPRGETGVCESCGLVVALNLADDDSRIESMNRANEARRTHDFDEAVRAWSRLVTEDPDNAEAHWNLALSRYGIDYVWDELTADYLPTINRLRYDAFTDDPDYKAAVLNANENALVYYTQQAELIQGIQSRFLEIIRSEKEYDVFISFKAEDENGARTRDSVLAQEIYEQLTSKGLKVFYSRISLNSVSGQEYEPHIFAALTSARVMILVGTRLDYLTAPWVKNEWSRYLALMAEDPNRFLLPVYETMAPEFFPDEIPMREALDMSAPGAMLDLTQGVLNLLGRENTAASRAEYNRLTDRMRECLAEGSFGEANSLGRKALEIDPNGPDAWWMLFLAENSLREESELVNALINWADSRYFSQAYNLAGPRRRQLLEEVRSRYDEYLSGLDEESRLAAEAESASRKTEQLIRQARELMMTGRFEETAELLKDYDQRSAELEELRNDAELGIEYKKINRDNYLYDLVKRDHPELIETMERKESQVHRTVRNRLPGSSSKYLLYGAMIVVGYFLTYMFKTSSGVGNVSLILFLAGIMLYVWNLLAKMKKTGRRLLISIAAPFVGALVLTDLPNSVEKAAPLIGMLLLLALASPVLLEYLTSRRHGNDWKKVSDYYKQHIAPVEEPYRKEYLAHFEPLSKYGDQFSRSLTISLHHR